MQRIPARSALPRGETQPPVLVPSPSRLLVLYGSNFSTPSIQYLNKIIASTSLAPSVLEIDSNDPRGTARDAVYRLTRNGDAGSHLLLCAHGSVADRQRQGKHAVRVSTVATDAVTTRRVLHWITDDLMGSLSSRKTTGGSRPFIHLLSCHAGALRKELKPGSDLWQRAYVLIYSSKRRTSLGASGSAMKTAIRYLGWCERRQREVDPLKLMYLAGLRRGECMTLMGGDLSAPLVWHAPKSAADLSDQRSLAMLQGDPRDVARLHEHAAALTPAELGLLPRTSLRELLSSRLERDDVDSVSALLDAHPELRDAPDILGSRPLLDAAVAMSHRCMARLLACGASPNSVNEAGDVSALALSVYRGDLDGLSLLLDSGADPNLLLDDEGLTALRFAVEYNWKEGISCLLDHGARMDLRVDGLTCLESAAEDGFAEAVECLLSAGAGENDGLSAELVALARANGDRAIADMLEAALFSSSLRSFDGNDKN